MNAYLTISIVHWLHWCLVHG